MVSPADRRHFEAIAAAERAHALDSARRAGLRTPDENMAAALELSDFAMALAAGVPGAIKEKPSIAQLWRRRALRR